MLQQIIGNVVNNTVAVGVLELSGIPALIKPNSNQVVKVLANGAMFSIAEEGVDYVMHGTSKLMEGQYLNFVDSALYNAIIYAGIEATDADFMLYNAISGVSPLPPFINQNLAMGCLVAGAKTLEEVLAQNVQNRYFQYLVHPTSIIMNR